MSNFSQSCFLVLLIVSVCTAQEVGTTLYLPITKDASTLQYITTVGQRTPLVPVKLTLNLGGFSLWVDCEKFGYKSSTYKAAVCGSSLCSFSGAHACGDCLFSDHIQPGCNNNTCYIWGDNPSVSYMDRAEIAEDLLAIGSTPGIVYTKPNFIFTCASFLNLSNGLADGVSGMAGFGHKSPVSIPNQLGLDSRFSRKFGVCLSSSTTSPGVIFIGAGPYYVYKPKLDISKTIAYAPMITNLKGFLQTSEYHIKLSSIRIAGKDVPFNKTLLTLTNRGIGGTRIRTTDPFTILHTSIYDAVKTAFVNALPKNVTIVDPPASKPFRACFSSNNIRSTNLGPDVPVIDFLFPKKKAFWRIYGANSMVQVGKDVMCLAFVRQDQTWEQSIIIGGHQMEENLLEFDITKKRIGFSSSLKLQKTSCAKYDYTSKTS